MTVTALDARLALVVIDLQRAIAAGHAEPHPVETVVANAFRLADAFRERNMPVVLVRVDRSPDGVDWAHGRTEAHTPTPISAEGLAFVPGLQQDDDLVVVKRNWSAFYGTDLEPQLRRRGVTQVVLAGVLTSIGVEATARGAHERGYTVTLATDAMTDRSAEAHRHSVERIFPRLGERGSTKEILALLEGRPRSAVPRA